MAIAFKYKDSASSTSSNGDHLAKAFVSRAWDLILGNSSTSNLASVNHKLALV